MTPPLKPHPEERDNWEYLNEGQRRYAVEQWQLARVRRGLPIDHPIPEVPENLPAALPSGEDILDELPEGNPEDVEDFDLDQLPAEAGPSGVPDTEPVSNPDDSTPPDEGDSPSMSDPLTPPVTPVKTPAKGKGKRGDKDSPSTGGVR